MIRTLYLVIDEGNLEDIWGFPDNRARAFATLAEMYPGVGRVYTDRVSPFVGLRLAIARKYDLIKCEKVLKEWLEGRGEGAVEVVFRSFVVRDVMVEGKVEKEQVEVFGEKW